MAVHKHTALTLWRRRLRIRRRPAVICSVLCVVLIIAITFAVPGAYAHRTGPMDLAPSLLRLQARYFPAYDRIWRRYTRASNATRAGELFEHTILAALRNDYTGPLHHRDTAGVYAQQGSEYPPTKAFWSLYPSGLATAYPQGMVAFNSFPESGPWSVPTVNGQQLLVLYKPLRFPPILTKDGWVGGYFVYATVPPASVAINVPKLATAGSSVLGSLGLLFGLSFAIDARERRRRLTLALSTCDDLIHTIETSLEFRALDSDSPVRQRYDRALELYASARDERGVAPSDTEIESPEGSAERALYLLTDVQSSLDMDAQSA